MAKSDINIVLGADYEKSIEQLNKDIARIEKKLNKLNVQVKVQSGNLLTETNKKISELQKRKTLKRIAIDMKLNEGKYIKQIKELETLMKKLQEQSNINLNVNSNNASANVSNLNTQLKQTTATANTLGATIKNALNDVGIYINKQTAWLALRKMISDINDTIREYDGYVTELALITNKSRDEVSGMLEGISETALNLKVDVSDVEKAETTILRAGKSIEDTQKLVEDAVKLSAAGFIGADEAAEHLITISNAYHLEADEMERIADKFVKLDSSANVTAGNLAGAIATAASNAKLAGINIDTLSGYIAALKDTTGKTEQSISTALNTILARMNNIKLNKFEEEIDADEIEVALNNVERMLNNVNIKLRDSKNEFKDADEVIKEVAEHWKDFTTVEQSSIANVFAGVRNRNVFVSLMENFERAEKLADEAANSAGTLSQKYSAYLDSIEAKTAELSTATKNLWANLLPADFLGNMTEATTATVQFIDKYKILQTLMKSALFYGAAKGIVFLGDSAKTAWNSIKQLSTAMTTLDAVQKSKNTANYANNLLSLGNACKGLNDKQLQLVLSTKSLTAAEKQQVLVTAGLTTEEAAAKIQTLGLATAETTATATTFSLSGALKALWATIAANPIGALTIAFGLVLTAINAVKQAEEEAKQKEIEHAEAIKELANETRNEIEEIDDLYDKYVEIKKAVDNGTGSKEELTQVTEALIKKLGLEREEVQKLVDEYGNLDKAITQATVDKIKEKLPDLADALKQSGKELYDTAQESVFLIKASDDMVDVIEKFMSEKGGISYADWLSDEGGKKYIVKQNAEGYADLVKGEYTDAAIKAIKEEYQTLTELREYLFSKGLTDTDTYNSVKDRLAEITPLYNEYIEQLNSYNDQAAQAVVKQKLINSTLPKTLDDYISFREELLKYSQSDENIVLFRGGIEEAQEAVLRQLTSNSFLSEYESKFKDLQTLTEKYIKDNLDSLGNIEIGSAKFNTLSKKIAEAFKDIPIEDFDIATKIPDLFADGLEGATAKIEKWKKDNANKITTDDVLKIDVSEVVKTNSAKVKLLTTAMKEMQEQGSITSSTYDDLISMGGNFSDCIEIENGKIKLNIDKLKELEAQELDNIITANSLRIETLNESKARSDNAEAIDAEIKALERQNALYKTMKDEISGASPTETKTIKSGRESDYTDRLNALKEANKGTIEAERNFVSQWQALNDEIFKSADPDKWAEINKEIKKYAREASKIAENSLEEWGLQNAYDANDTASRETYAQKWKELNKTAYLGSTSDNLFGNYDTYKEQLKKIANYEADTLKKKLEKGLITYQQYLNELEKIWKNARVLNDWLLPYTFITERNTSDMRYTGLMQDYDRRIDYDADADKNNFKKRQNRIYEMKSVANTAYGIGNPYIETDQNAYKKLLKEIEKEQKQLNEDIYNSTLDRLKKLNDKSLADEEEFINEHKALAKRIYENTDYKKYEQILEDIANYELEVLNKAYDKGLKNAEEYEQGVRDIFENASKNGVNLGESWITNALDPDRLIERKIADWEKANNYDSKDSKYNFDLRTERLKYIKEMANQLYGENGENYPASFEKWMKEVAEEETKILEDRIDREREYWNDKKSQAEKYYSARIAELEAEKDEIERITKQESLRNELIKARQRLEEIKNNRNQLIFNNGTFEYVADQDALISAQEDLAEKEKAVEEAAREQEIKIFEQQRDNAVKFYDELLEKIDELTKEPIQPKSDSTLLTQIGFSEEEADLIHRAAEALNDTSFQKDFKSIIEGMSFDIQKVTYENLGNFMKNVEGAITAAPQKTIESNINRSFSNNSNNKVVNNDNRSIQIGDINLNMDMNVESLDDFVDSKINLAFKKATMAIQQRLPQALLEAGKR